MLGAVVNMTGLNGGRGRYSRYAGWCAPGVYICCHHAAGVALLPFASAFAGLCRRQPAGGGRHRALATIPDFTFVVTAWRCLVPLSHVPSTCPARHRAARPFRHRRTRMVQLLGRQPGGATAPAPH